MLLLKLKKVNKMITLTKPYTDVHGITHSAAIIVVQNIRYDKGTNLNAHAEISAEKIVTYKTSDESGHSHLGFSAHLYASVEAFEQGLLPLQLRNSENMQDFYIDNPPLTASPVVGDLIDFCEQYILTEIIK